MFCQIRQIRRVKRSTLCDHKTIIFHRLKSILNVNMIVSVEMKTKYQDIVIPERLYNFVNGIFTYLYDVTKKNLLILFVHQNMSIIINRNILPNSDLKLNIFVMTKYKLRNYIFSQSQVHFSIKKMFILRT